MLSQHPDIAMAAVDAMRPPPDLSPSEFAERYRWLKEGSTHLPGRWSGDVFPYLNSIMDAAQEAVAQGKQGVVMIKSGQGGGSEASINVFAWADVHLPGPSIYLISKDEVAREFGRDRFSHLLDTCEPIKRKALRGRQHGELIHIKRLTTGKWVIAGGRSVTNLESQPYRKVFVDEIDSLMTEVGGKGDTIDNALIRMDAFNVPTLAWVFAHPTTADRGAGLLYYSQSDQRRGFVTCVHCGDEFWLQWDHVLAIAEGDETQAQAEKNPARYHYYAPCCGAELSDPERYAMAARAEQRSTIDPAEAATKRWIGVHFSQLYMSNKPLEFLAAEWIKAKHDEGKLQVFYNKRLGDVFRAQERHATPDAWRQCILHGAGGTPTQQYMMGQVPADVQWLTAGQDSGAHALHWAIMGWGYVPNEAGGEILCGWLIDCGVVERIPPSQTLEAADLTPMDGLIYDRWFERADGRNLAVTVGMHDSGWQPIGAYTYCLDKADRAWPSKGMATDSHTAARTRPVTVTKAPPFRIAGRTYDTSSLQYAKLNTYILKAQLVGMVERGVKRAGGAEHQAIMLPADVPDRFVQECASERLEKEKTGDKWRWRAHGPNHYFDCVVGALGAAVYMQEQGVTDRRPTATINASNPPKALRQRSQQWKKPERGGWWTGSRHGGRGRW